MGDYQKPVQSAREQVAVRARTVDGLFADAILGMNRTEKPWAISETPTTISGDWQKLISGARAKFGKSETAQDAEHRAENSVMLRQLDVLDKLYQPGRTLILNALADNGKTFANLAETAPEMQKALRTGNFDIGQELQHKIIAQADRLNQNALSFEQKCLQKESSQTTDSIKKAVIDRSIDSNRITMAAPFIERARLYSILNKAEKPYQAEKALADALTTQIPAEAMQSVYVKELRQNAVKQLANLRVENNLLQTFDQNLAKLDIHPHDNVISMDELKSAKRKSDDTNLQALTGFLTENFNYLSGKHWTIFGPKGIKRSDLVEFDKERRSKINDLQI